MTSTSTVDASTATRIDPDTRPAEAPIKSGSAELTPATTTAPAPPAAVERAGGGDEHDPEAAGFMRAVMIGIVLGIPILAAVVALGVWIAAPDTNPWAILGIAGWVSLFCGPFLAGTVTVGLWSSHQH